MPSATAEENESPRGEQGQREKQVSETPSGGDGEEAGEESPSHLPLVPSSEVLDASTTVDPSYIISLIRKILPHDKTTDNACEIELNGEETTHQSIDAAKHLSSVEDTWEECGCILWDLSMEKDHGTFMVNNLILDVLLANLSISNSSRITEICLGITGNLACHDNLATILVSREDLVETIVGHLFLDDSACLLETCRLLTVGLRGVGLTSWVEALQPEHILERILWIAENTLSLQLLEKTIELLLTIVDNQDVGVVLLPSLNKLGLPNLLVKLLDCEMSKLIDENKTERISIIDLVLQSIESLSTIDGYSESISSNEGLFHVLCGVVKLPDKMEVGALCPTTVVIIANILTDEAHLAAKVSQDINFLKGLLDIFPLISSDQQARNALWSILARLLSHVQPDADSDLPQHVHVLADKAYIIEDDLDSHPDGGFVEGSNGRNDAGQNINLSIPALRRIAALLDHWIMEPPSSLSDDMQLSANGDTRNNAERLLDCCLKYITPSHHSKHSPKSFC